MNFYYFYILRSKKNEKLYLGFTKNWKKRFKEHNSGKVKSTKDFRPLKLIFFEAYPTKSDAKEERNT